MRNAAMKTGNGESRMFPAIYSLTLRLPIRHRIRLIVSFDTMARNNVTRLIERNPPPGSRMGGSR